MEQDVAEGVLSAGLADPGLTVGVLVSGLADPGLTVGVLVSGLADPGLTVGVLSAGLADPGLTAEVPLAGRARGLACVAASTAAEALKSKLVLPPRVPTSAISLRSTLQIL